MSEISELLLRLLTSSTLLASLVFVVGIVWRVEAELDTAYKLFTVATLFLCLSEVGALLPGVTVSSWGGTCLAVMRLAAAGALFLGMYFMRDLVRRMDGERRS